MSVVVRNGKVELERKPKGIDAPTPSEIAARAYDLAVDLAIKEVARWNAATHEKIDAETLKTYLGECRATALAALRDSIINHPAIPWWRK